MEGYGSPAFFVPFGNSLAYRAAQQTYNRYMVWNHVCWTDLRGTSEKTGRGRRNSHDCRFEKAGLEMRAWDGRKCNVSILWPDTSKLKSFMICSLSGAVHPVVTHLAALRQGHTSSGNKLQESLHVLFSVSLLTDMSKSCPTSLLQDQFLICTG